MLCKDGGWTRIVHTGHPLPHDLIWRATPGGWMIGNKLSINQISEHEI